MRCELGRLQNQLQNMEMRAVEVESDVRHAMTTGQCHCVEYSTDSY